MELGFAGGGSLLDGVDTTQMFDLGSGLSLGESPRDVYQKLLTMQRDRLPFDVTTGKRQYQNMLIKSLDVTTDKVSENVLMCSLTLREVIITANPEHYRGRQIEYGRRRQYGTCSGCWREIAKDDK